MPAALELVKRELGTDAVILGTRCVSAAGVGRLVGRDQVEITAAPSGTPAHPPRLGRMSARPGGAADLTAQSSDAPALPEHVHPYYLHLVQNEVAEELAVRLLRDATAAVPANKLTDGRLLRIALRRCITQLVPTVEDDAASAPARKLALVGPPGGGKTTTLAKLAAAFKLHHGRSVGLLSLDMHRLAAGDQLRRYADVIGVPLESVQTIEALREALERLRGVDCLLIDTPGVGPREQGRFARLAALLRAARPDEVHLVLPACRTAASQTRVAQAFQPLGVSRVVLTHLDEAVGFGVVLNAVDKLKLNLSYLASGQNVPQDLERACSPRIAELILPVGS